MIDKNSKVTIKQIFAEYFKGVRPQKNLAILTISFFTIGSLISVFTPYFYKDFFNILNSTVNKTDSVESLIKIIIIIAVLNIINWIFTRIAFFILLPSTARTEANLKQNSFNYLIKHSHNFFTNNFTGSLVQKINRQSRAYDRLFDTLVFNIIPLLITVIGAVIITFFTSKILSIVILVWVTLYFSFSFIFYKWRMKYDIEMAKVDSEVTGLLSDNISNSQTISLFNSFVKEIESYKQATIKQAKIIIKTWNYAGVYETLQQFLVCAVEFVVFYYAITYWQADKLTVGGIVMIQIYIVSLAKQIWSINFILRNIFESLADSKQMTEIMITPYEIQNTKNASDIKMNGGEIEFNNVSFTFNETKNVLDNIRCKILRGEKIALVGASGAGKTTFIRLILRLYNLTNGQILIDGQNISQVTQESLRQSISLVPQDPVLFHRTLMENIRYGRREATDEEVREAARLAYCDEFIDTLPDKYETFVGERGIKLSGGERQRVAIARAILKKAPVLILDEATSSLDSHSEALIQNALDNLMKNCTTIIIAHRLSTIRKMDRIIVMENGKIIEDGTHDELSNKDSGVYKDLWELQVGGFIQK
ncbi:MAG: ABC transporter ATP-binding protein [bacterium]